MKRLSFIVPFYNVEPYIEQCIRSLYNQDIPQEEYEVICIDDCSPDGSRAIVERLQTEYSTLRLFTTPENLRQGGARNMGMDVAEGRYVWFVDSDDYIIPNCLDYLLGKAETEDLDLLRIYNRTEHEHVKNMVDFGPCTGSELVFDAPMPEKPEQRCSTVWIGLISLKLLKTHKIRFAEKVQYEDDDFAYRFYANAERAHVVPVDAYIVRYVADSTTHKKRSLTTMIDLLAEAKRISLLSKQLINKDFRWKNLTHNTTAWTCKGQVLKWLVELSEEEQKKFFINGILNVKGLTKHLTLNEILALSSYHYFKYVYYRNKK